MHAEDFAAVRRGACGFLKSVLQDGTVRQALTLLPSAAFYIEKRKKDGEDYLLLRGGGFGHGTGMSQWGAVMQAKSGWSYEKILKYYFSGISISGMA